MAEKTLLLTNAHIISPDCELFGAAVLIVDTIE